MNPSSSQTLRILVCHADPLVAAGIVAALGAEPDFDVRRLDAGAGGPPRAAAAAPADVLVVDYQAALDTLCARAATRELPGQPSPRLLVVTARDGEWCVRTALKAGVHGYTLTSRPLHELVEAVRAMRGGARYLCTAVAARLADSLGSEPLTARETQVLEELVAGAGNKIIARRLEVSVGTIKAHMRSLMSKLQARTRTEAVSIALTRGIVDGPGRGGARSGAPLAA